MDRPNTIPWPPILYGLAVIAGFLLQRYIPLPWFPLFTAEYLFMLGIIMVLAGLAIDISAMLALRKHKTTAMPHKAASQLVTTGPFSFSRNPIYLGNTILTFGLGFVFGNVWLFVTGLAAALITNRLAIKREEAHLKAKFGTAWRKYATRVRRWI